MPPAPADAVGITTLADRESLRRDVGLRLDTACARVRTLVSETGTGAERLSDLLEVMLGGGKRLRAAFAYWAWRAHGGSPGEGAGGSGPQGGAIIEIGAALELFQAAALFHDDVIDRSDRRRGHPTAHVVLAADHRAAGWEGSAPHHGTAGAILLGDLALVAAGTEISGAAAQLPPQDGHRVRALWDEMATTVTAGQFLDVQAQAVPWGRDPAADELRAREVILAKTASYSAELPLAMGAATAGASDTAVASMRAFGRTLGEAFQLRDDVLGVFGDPEQTGKPAGDDVREGKRTLLLARAAVRADPGQRALIAQRLGRADLSAADVDQVREVLVTTGALDSVEERITELYETALRQLAQAELTSVGRASLEELAAATVQRSV